MDSELWHHFEKCIHILIYTLYIYIYIYIHFVGLVQKWQLHKTNHMCGRKWTQTQRASANLTTCVNTSTTMQPEYNWECRNMLKERYSELSLFGFGLDSSFLYARAKASIYFTIYSAHCLLTISVRLLRWILFVACSHRLLHFPWYLFVVLERSPSSRQCRMGFVPSAQVCLCCKISELFTHIVVLDEILQILIQVLLFQIRSDQTMSCRCNRKSKNTKSHVSCNQGRLTCLQHLYFLFPI